MPLAGVPYHSVDYYLKRLVDNGYRVAIAEQITELGKGLVERGAACGQQGHGGRAKDARC